MSFSFFYSFKNSNETFVFIICDIISIIVCGSSGSTIDTNSKDSDVCSSILIPADGNYDLSQSSIPSEKDASVVIFY